MTILNELMKRARETNKIHAEKDKEEGAIPIENQPDYCLLSIAQNKLATALDIVDWELAAEALDHMVSLTNRWEYGDNKIHSYPRTIKN